MKLLSLSILSAMTSVMFADNRPEDFSIERYRELVDRSPFTDPVVPITTPIITELPGWALVGVRKYRDEQFVTILNLKDRKQRVEIPGAEALSLGFNLLEVDVARSFLNTKAKIQRGTEVGWLEYDSKLLSINKPLQKPAPVKVSKSTELPPVPGKRVRYVPRPK